MHRTIFVALTAALSVRAPAALPGSAQNFLERAERLEARGPFGLIDSDYSRLRAEATAVGRSIADDRIAAEKAGRRILYCSPSPKAELGSFEFIKGLETIPSAERGHLSLKQAMIRILEKKYPCPT